MDNKDNTVIIKELESSGLFLLNGAMNPSFIKKFNNLIKLSEFLHWKKWYEVIPGDSFSEKIYLLYNKRSVCKFCGQLTRFSSYGVGYRDYCDSKDCRNKGRIASMKKKCFDIYGVEYPAQSKELMNKMKSTTKARHGVDNIFKDTERMKQAYQKVLGVDNPLKSKKVRDKSKKTCLERYNTEYPNKSKKVLDKRAKTNLKKYNNICSIHGEEIWKKVIDTRNKDFWEKLNNSDRLKELVKPLFSFEEYIGTIDKNGKIIYYYWKCVKCNHEFKDYLANGNIPRCPICYPTSIRGTLEKEFGDWLKSVLPDEIIYYNSRKIISPLELDFYIPNKKIAIEFDEIYWHSEKASKGIRNKNYHIDKTQQCSKKKIGLIHIFENDWWEKKEIVQSIILSKLGKYNQRIGARHCEIRKISAKEGKLFLENNHLQGAINASIRYGIYCKSELVSCIYVSPNRFKKNTYEIARYAVKKNTTIIGGFQKLWKQVEKNLNSGDTVLSYVDLKYFEGKINEMVGFEYSHTNPPGYQYTKNYKTLENRMKFQKKNIKKTLVTYSPDLTEWENLQLAGYDRIWDCGIKVYKKIIGK